MKRMGFDFNTDVELDKLDGGQTNDEWRKTCSTEEFAEWVSDIVYECSDKMVQEDGYGCAVCNLHWCSKQDVLEWLKEKHI